MSDTSLELEDGARVRRALASDLTAIVAIRRGLPMPSPNQADGGGGSFLLGSEVDTYARLLEQARMWILEVEGEAIGFTLTLADPILRASSLWAQRETIEWLPESDAESALEGRIAYFDQLAVLPHVRRRSWSASLALRALSELIHDEGHTRVLTTTVLEPVLNQAALPYLTHLGARQIGRLEEHYPEVGTILSALHLIEARGFWAYAEALAGVPRPGIQAILAGVARAARNRDPRVLNPPRPQQKEPPTGSSFDS